MGRVKSYNTRKGQSLTGSGSSSSPTTQSTIIRLSRLDQVVVGCMERLVALQMFKRSSVAVEIRQLYGVQRLWLHHGAGISA